MSAGILATQILPFILFIPRQMADRWWEWRLLTKLTRKRLVRHP